MEKSNRMDKVNYYLRLAEVALERSTCSRRNYGAVLVKNDEIIATGYNGAPRGRRNCNDLSYCMREKLNIPRGERYEMCRSVHAEANAIISAERSKMMGSTMYLAGKNAETQELETDVSSCAMCKKLIINAGIKMVIIRNGKDKFTSINVSDWVYNDDSITGETGY
ncbi:MAG: cytidine/deoxycytidylate deaminase family protein [Oscillospiraceae bacterium]|nr:cytidine/deoxycytidylate deaminase family protein [Oscillospiraceae bacterium]